MITVNVTWLSWLMAIAVAYYALLLAVMAVRRTARRRSRSAAGQRLPFMVLVIPAHNEQAVISQTLTTLDRLDYPDRLILVMDDGSVDATADLARHWVTASRLAGSGPVRIVSRSRDIAGQGKGAVLNHAFAHVTRMAADHDPLLGGRSPDEIVIGVMDADGQLEADALSKVAPYFLSRRNRRVGAVQIGVRIANATVNLLTRMQDFEFVGFSALVQEARNGLGSVGLGGNGQFTRLSALLSLGRDPWTKCLTEDLDVSLSLAELGWDIAYCPDTFVAQQGLTRIGPLLRQRARWIQGHYQCWRHLGPIWRSGKLPWRAKIDLSIYLLMVAFLLVVVAGLVVSILGWARVLIPINTSLDYITNPYIHSLVQLLLSVGPLAVFFSVYQLRAASALRWFELPAFAVLFASYAYLFLISQIWAWARIAAGRGGWAKTPRVSADIAVQIDRQPC